MIIANPIYDVVFKYLMEDLDIAKGMISAIIGETVEELHFQAQEQVVERAKTEIHPHIVSLQRLDFVARIRVDDGHHKKVLIELQKARLSSDIGRFRTYLGKRYQERDEITENGVVIKKSLPIISIYILGFNLEPDMPACIKVDRRYLNLITKRRIKAECDFLEGLSHDLYVIQARKLNHQVRTDLERILCVFGQDDFSDKKGQDIALSDKYAGKNALVKKILRRLAAVREDVNVRESMDNEDRIYEEFEAGLRERTSALTQKLRLSAEELEEAQKREEEAQTREEEAQKREEEERRQKEDAQKQKEDALAKALDAMVAAGIPPEEARKTLGLD
jgi:hypothetical protein